MTLSGLTESTRVAGQGGERAVVLDGDREVVAGDELVGQPAQAGDKAEVVEDRWAQLERGRADRLVRLVEQVERRG